MKLSSRHLLFFVMIVGIAWLSSCNSYQKVVRSSDVEYKYTKAIEFYNKGSYYKAIPIIEDLLVLYKGTERAEELYYYYANCHYQQGSYSISAYHFKNFVNQYPYSGRARESLYLYAMSHYNISPQRSLDQENTYKAIEAFQLFINTYPESDRVDDANVKIDYLRKKLEEKAVDNADLYFKTQNYRAAANAYINILITYPDIDNPELISFKALKARLRFADKSTFRRQVERYEETVKVYKDFTNKYPDSEYKEDADKIFEEANYKVIKSSFTEAYLSPLQDRERMFSRTIRNYEKCSPHLKLEKYRKDALEMVEESHFLIIKSNYQLAQTSANTAKTKWYNKTINSYYNFIDKYSSSKFANEAEKIYQTSSENLNKLKNG